MNIALFSDSYLPTKSGIVTVVIQLRQILEQMGHHVVIVTVDAGPDGQVEDDPCVLRVPSLHSPVGDEQYMGFPRRRRVIEFLKKNNIQIIHSHTEFFLGHMANVAGKKLKIPVIATTHTMWEDYSHYVNPIHSETVDAVVKKVKGGRDALTPLELREKCREYAHKSLKGQESEFKRLGVWGVF